MKRQQWSLGLCVVRC